MVGESSILVVGTMRLELHSKVYNHHYKSITYLTHFEEPYLKNMIN